MIVTGPDAFPTDASERELPLEKNGAFGVLTAGEAGAPKDMDSNVVVGTDVFERWSSRCRGRSVGGRGAGPGFMNWPV